MSDARVKFEVENDPAKRRTGAGNFSGLLSSGSGGAARSQYALMADFLDEAFEDHKLDGNELEAMKVLAGMTPGCKTTTLPSPAALACAPAAPEAPYDVKAEVARELDKSKDWDTGEQMVLDTVNRLMGATREQQMAFTRELCRLMSDNDVDESGGSEGTSLDAFVDGLLGGESRTPAPARAALGPVGQSCNDRVRDYLSEAMKDKRVSCDELDSLRSLLNGSATQANDRHAGPNREAERVRLAPTRFDAGYSAWLDEMVRTGEIRNETAQRVRDSWC